MVKGVSVCQTDNEILSMKLSGMSLRQIGKVVNISHETVRRRLKSGFGEIHSTYIAEAMLGRLIGSTFRVKHLREQGLINPKRWGLSFLYSPEEVAKAKRLLRRFCPACGIMLEIRGYKKYCPECRKKYRRNHYQFMSPEAKKRHHLCVRQWRKNHPEKAKEINKKAFLKYRDKKKAEHYATTEYVVVGGNILPFGDIIKATGCQDSKLLLADRSRIPISYVRLLRRGKG